MNKSIFDIENIVNDLFPKGINFDDIINKYDSPLYIFSEHKIKENIDIVKSIYKDVYIHYACKANSNITLLRIVKECNLGIEVSSESDLLKAIMLKFSPDKIIFNGPAKTDKELGLAVDTEIKSINVDSECELLKIIEIARVKGKIANICLRVALEIESENENYSKTWNDGGKFGIELLELPRLISYFETNNCIKLVGFHLHIGSQIVSSNIYQLLINKFIGGIYAISNKFDFNEKMLLNIGSGFPIHLCNYELPTVRSTADEYYKSTIGAISNRFGCDFFKKFQFVIEPGRIIVANTAILLSQIIAIKSRSRLKEKWLIINAGFETLLEILSNDWNFGIYASKFKTNNYNVPYRIGGPLCDGDDVYSQFNKPNKYHNLPADLEINDILIFTDVGAYNIELMTNFNGRYRAAAVLYKLDGACSIIRKRDTFESLILNEIIS